MPEPATAARCLFETARAAGVDLCLANPGTTEMPLVAALDEVPGVRAVLGLFEGVCTGAADGFARMTGRPALTLLHLGPGFANGIANLHNARRAASPIVNLVGDQTSWHLAFDAPLTSDIESLARPVSGWVRTTADPAKLASDTAEAIAAACAPPGQVSTLVIPADHQAARVGGGPAALPPMPSRAVPGDDAIEAAAAWLGGGEAVLLLGGSALDATGQRAAARIAAATGARVLVETFPARWERGGELPAFGKLPYFPEQAIEALAGARVLLAGVRPPVAFFGYEGTPSRLAPEESVRSLAEPAEDAVAALEALAERLGADAAPSASPPLPDPPSGPLAPATIGAALARSLPENAIVVDEAATSGLPFIAQSAGAPAHTLLSLTGGAIGQGLPTATGAALACPDRKVVAFQADGSGAYTLQALWTQAREGLDVVTLLCANRAYRILQVELARAGIAEAGPQARSLTQLDAPETDWVSLARGFGVPGERLESAEALSEALPRALAEPGPRLLELVIR